MKINKWFVGVLCLLIGFVFTVKIALQMQSYDDVEVSMTPEELLRADQRVVINELEAALKAKIDRPVYAFYKKVSALWPYGAQKKPYWQLGRKIELESWIMGIELLDEYTDEPFELDSNYGPNDASLFGFQNALKQEAKAWQIGFLMSVDNSFVQSIRKSVDEQAYQNVFMIIENTAEKPTIRNKLITLVSKLKTCSFTTIRHEITSSKVLCTKP